LSKINDIIGVLAQGTCLMTADMACFC